jgi:hypothetical protein
MNYRNSNRQCGSRDEPSQRADGGTARNYRRLSGRERKIKEKENTGTQERKREEIR